MRRPCAGRFVCGIIRALSPRLYDYAPPCRHGRSCTQPASKPADPEELYAKFTVAAAVFFLVLRTGQFPAGAEPPSVRDCRRSTGSARRSAAISSTPGWAAARAFAGGPAPWFDFAAYNTVLREITRPRIFPTISGPIRRISSCLPGRLGSCHTSRPMRCGAWSASRSICVAAVAGGVERQANTVPGGGAGRRGQCLLRPERFSHRGAADRRPRQSRPPADPCRRPVRHSHHQAAIRLSAAGHAGA